VAHLAVLVDGKAHVHALQTLVVVVKESLESQHLPAALTSEVVGQRLQLVHHHILNIVIVKNRVKQEAARTRIRMCVVAGYCLVEKGLACRLWPKVYRLLSSTIRHQLGQVLLEIRSCQVLTFRVT